MSDKPTNLDYESTDDTRKSRRPLTAREIIYWIIFVYLAVGITLILLGV